MTLLVGERVERKGRRDPRPEIREANFDPPRGEGGKHAGISSKKAARVPENAGLNDGGSWGVKTRRRYFAGVRDQKIGSTEIADRATRLTPVAR